MSTAGPMLVRNEMKLRWAPVPMMMLVGSPTRVAAPPMLAAKASPMRNGTGLTASRSHTSRVTGAINRTVVTLSRNADPIAVTSISRIMIRSGDPLARLADQDRDVFEHAGLAHHADDDHHPQQQKDDVPVDSGVL